MKPERGAVAVMFLLLVVFLLAASVFATDMARVFIAKSELQNAADACALAAAAALTGTNSAQLTLAESYGMAVASRNKVGLQSAGVTVAADQTVSFAATVSGVYRAKNAIAASQVLSMKFARCALAESNVRSLLAGLSTPAVIRATATASMTPSLSNCAIPLAMCRKTGTSAPQFGYAVGEWFAGRFSPGSGVSGKFKWVKFPGYERTSDLVSLIAAGGQCDLNQQNSVTPSTGVLNTIIDVWNWRFGVKKSSGAPAGAYPPDLTGYAYTASNWPSQFNARADFINRRAANTPWNNQPALTGGWSASTAAVHAAGGDRRMVVMPVVDCTSWDAGGQAAQSILGWACVLMLNPVATANDTMSLEYRGAAASMSSGCVTSGSPGGPGASGPNVPTLVM